MHGSNLDWTPPKCMFTVSILGNTFEFLCCSKGFGSNPRKNITLIAALKNIQIPIYIGFLKASSLLKFCEHLPKQTWYNWYIFKLPLVSWRKFAARWLLNYTLTEISQEQIFSLHRDLNPQHSDSGLLARAFPFLTVMCISLIDHFFLLGSHWVFWGPSTCSCFGHQQVDQGRVCPIEP